MSEYLMPILTLLAVVVGPTIGVLIAQYRDARKQKRQQQTDLLASLLRTRHDSGRLSAEHVGALNLIQLMFYGEKDVLEAYKRYMEHLNTPPPPQEQRNLVDSFIRDGQGRFLELLATLASALRFQFDKKDLENLAYAPQKWLDFEMAQQQNMYLLTELLSGRSQLPVSVVPQQDDVPPWGFKN